LQRAETGNWYRWNAPQVRPASARAPIAVLVSAVMRLAPRSIHAEVNRRARRRVFVTVLDAVRKALLVSVCADELGPDVVGVRMLQVIKDGERLLPGLAGAG
jgi:hypothetical protein